MLCNVDLELCPAVHRCWATNRRDGSWAEVARWRLGFLVGDSLSLRTSAKGALNEKASGDSRRYRKTVCIPQSTFPTSWTVATEALTLFRTRGRWISMRLF